MTREQWLTAWRIVNVARETPAPNQRAYIDSETSDPEVLRLVTDLLEAPLEEESPDAPVDRTGTQVGRYEIAALLGRGGMGEVYAGRDTELGRPVALKFLASGTGDPSAVKRFVREAKAASGLNHPNILTVHEVVQSPSGVAIAMELVEGQAVSDFRGTALRVPQVIDLGRQVASALAAAHAQGIVHRDIKPENLMVRPDGFVKVLDFGLAYDFVGQLTATLQPSRTSLPAGTLRYMSPEQLRGEPITGSSDVFSLGIVLYELAAGRHPFDAEYAWETAYAIHTRNPAPLSTMKGDVPAWLDGLILAMLDREAAVRPSAAQVESSLSESRAAIPSRGRRWRVIRGTPFQSRARRAVWTLPAIAIAIALAGYGWTSWRDIPRESNLTTVPVTTFGGSKRSPTFSPDGTRIAFSWIAPNQTMHHLYVKAIGQGDPVQVTAGPGEDVNPTWSPDGRQIAFCRRITSGDERTPATSGVHIVSSLGGADRKIADGCAGVSWSPDGSTLAVALAATGAADGGGIELVALESGGRRRLTTSREDLFPEFSPNGDWIGFIRALPGRGRGREIFVVPATGGEPRQLTFDGEFTTGVTWTADSREIVFASPRSRGQGSFWRIQITGGTPRPVSTTLRHASYPSISREGTRMVFTESWSDTNLHLRRGAGLPPAGMPWQFEAPVAVTFSTAAEHSPVFSPDGERIAFTSDRSGNNEIFASRREGSDVIQLTSSENNSAGSAAWSPDGAWIAFDMWTGNQSDIYVVNARGGTPRRVSPEPGGGWVPVWSPDGQWIYFMSDRSGRNQLWRMPAAGGASVQVTQTGGIDGRPSPDGRTVYVRTNTASGCCTISAVPAAGGREQPLKGLEGFAVGRSWGVLAQGIYFLASPDERRHTVRFLNLATHQVVDLVTLDREPNGSFLSLAMSSDGRYLLNGQIDLETNNLMMVENFR